MDVFFLLFMAVVSILFGIIITLVIQYYVLIKFFNKGPIISPKTKNNHEAYSLPEAIKKSIEEDGMDKSSDSSLPISLVLQFLFHELRHSDTIKRWLYKKLSMEFDELLTKTTIGKFFETVTIQDMNLGNEFPDIQSIKLDSIKLDKNDGHIDTLNLSVKLDYSGNFMISVDAKMKFGKTAYLCIKVKHVSGLARLQFTRLPYTHWSLSFYNEPDVEVAVESRLRGRQLQAHVHNLVAHQIKKAVRRKHTLPNYKIRYRPFFTKTDPGGEEEGGGSGGSVEGRLEVVCVEVSRLAVNASSVEMGMGVYCTLAVADVAWVSLTSASDNIQAECYTMVIDITIRRDSNRQRSLGASFKAGTADGSCVTVDAVDEGGAAFRAGLKPQDYLIAVEGRRVSGASVAQVARLIRSSPAATVSLRIQRRVSVQKLHTVGATQLAATLQHVSLPDSEPITTVSSHSVPLNVVDVPSATATLISADGSFVMVEHESTGAAAGAGEYNNTGSRRSGVAKMAAQTLGSLAALRKRKSVSLERSAGCVVTSPPPPPLASQSAYSTPHHRPSLHHEHLLNYTSDSNATANQQDHASLVRQTKLVELSSVMQMKDEFTFDAKDGSKYLNINVWGSTISTSKEDGKEGEQQQETAVLLGYSNISLVEVVNSCRTSKLGHYVKRYWFLPPSNTSPTIQSHPLISHSGFEHVFCYGDILLSFVWSAATEGGGEGVIGGGGATSSDAAERKLSTGGGGRGGGGGGGGGSDFDSAPQRQSSKQLSMEHDFIRTQFHRSVHCDFCSKKIWLKDAVQCRACGLCCHRKCVARCQMGGGSCPTPGLPNSSNQATSTNTTGATPEIITTEPPIDTNNVMSTATTTGAALKRVNSATNLSLLVTADTTHGTGGGGASSSLSLPPSPQRRRSLATNEEHRRQGGQGEAEAPFELCGVALEQVWEGSKVEGEVNDRNETVERVLERLMQWPADELLMAAAKETGRTMYRELAAEERAERIGAMMAALKRVFDNATEQHADLQRSLGVGVVVGVGGANTTSTDQVVRARTAFLLGQADAKMHALSVLMLHYCSALQQTHDKII